MIIFKNVSRIFNRDHTALERATFEIKDGEFVLLIGRSGAGKTTILKLISRADVPTHGQILYKNLNYDHIRKKDIVQLRRKIVSIFQDFKLLMDQSVFDNVMMGLEILGKPMREAQKKAEEALRQVDLYHHGPILARFLSGGEKQRVAIARAIAMDAEVILADEPTGNLDPISGKEVMDLMKKINAQGKTIIMATHNKEVVDMLKTRVITLSNGRIAKDETPGKFTLV